MGDGVAGIFGTKYLSTFLAGAATGGFIGGVLGFLLGRKLGEAEKEKIIWATGHLASQDAEQLNGKLRPLLESLLRNLDSFDLPGLPEKIGVLLEKDMLQYGLLHPNSTRPDIMGYQRLASPSILSLMPEKFALNESGIFELFHSYFEQREEIASHNRATALAFVTCLYNICRMLTLFMLMLSEYPGKQAAAAIEHCHNALLAFLKNVENSNLTSNTQWNLGSLFSKQRKTLVAVLPIPCEQFRDSVLMLQQEKGIVECGKLAEQYYEDLFSNTLELLLRLTDVQARRASVPIKLEKLRSGILYYDTAEKTGRVALDESTGINKAIAQLAITWLSHKSPKTPISRISYAALHKTLSKTVKTPQERTWLDELIQIAYLLMLACKFEQIATKKQYTCHGYERNKNGNLIRLRILCITLLKAVQPRLNNLFTQPELHNMLLACQEPETLEKMGISSPDGAAFLAKAETRDSLIQTLFACPTSISNGPLFNPMQKIVHTIFQLDYLQKTALELLKDETTPIPSVCHIRGYEALYGHNLLRHYDPDNAALLFQGMHHNMEAVMNAVENVVKRLRFEQVESLFNTTYRLTIDGTAQDYEKSIPIILIVYRMGTCVDFVPIEEKGFFTFQRPVHIDGFFPSRLKGELIRIRDGLREVKHPANQGVLKELAIIISKLESIDHSLVNSRKEVVSAIAEELEQSRNDNRRLDGENRELSHRMQTLGEQVAASQSQLNEALAKSKEALTLSENAQRALTDMCAKLLEEFDIQLQLIDKLKTDLHEACRTLQSDVLDNNLGLINRIEQLESTIDRELGKLATRTLGMSDHFKTQSQAVKDQFEALRGRLAEQTNELSQLKKQLQAALQKIRLMEEQSKRLYAQPKHAFLKLNALDDIRKKIEKSEKKLSFFRSSRPVKEDNLLTFIGLLLDNKEALQTAFRTTPETWDQQKTALLDAHMVNYSRGLSNTSTSRSVFQSVLKAFEQNRLENALADAEIQYHGQAIVLHTQPGGKRFVQYQAKSQMLAF